MIFPHEDPEFNDLLQIVAGKRHLSLALVEKDYWVIHTLWAVHHMGLKIWFKGGTSLSKGFDLIERFSEDLDLKIEPGSVVALPSVSNWKSEGKKATEERRVFFSRLLELLQVPGATLSSDPIFEDKAHRNALIRVIYPGQHLEELSHVLKPFVLLEIGHARVTPCVECAMSSFVHDELIAQNQLTGFVDNRPRAVRCVHPLVTLLEKLDALHRRVSNEKADPASFVRHYEDAAHIIDKVTTLPPLETYEDIQALAEDMLAHKQIAALPVSDDAAFALPPGERTESIVAAHAAIEPMFWGQRIELKNACRSIRHWIRATFHA